VPILIEGGRSSILITRAAFERMKLTRADIDRTFNLTDQEFKVEGQLVVLGPLPSDDLAEEIFVWLEGHGLVHFEDFFDLTGNWPEWLNLYVMSKETA
jgi:hypothetical protein